MGGYERDLPILSRGWRANNNWEPVDIGAPLLVASDIVDDETALHTAARRTRLGIKRPPSLASTEHIFSVMRKYRIPAEHIRRVLPVQSARNWVSFAKFMTPELVRRFVDIHVWLDKTAGDLYLARREGVSLTTRNLRPVTRLDVEQFLYSGQRSLWQVPDGTLSVAECAQLLAFGMTRWNAGSASEQAARELARIHIYNPLRRHGNPDAALWWSYFIFAATKSGYSLDMDLVDDINHLAQRYRFAEAFPYIGSQWRKPSDFGTLIRAGVPADLANAIER